MENIFKLYSLVVLISIKESYEQSLLKEVSQFIKSRSPGYEHVPLANEYDYDPDKDNFYLLRTREIPDGEIMTIENITETHFNRRNRIVLLIHGWSGDHNTDTNTLISAAYLETEAANVISLDWSAGAKQCYLCACFNALKAGKSVGQFLKNLMIVTRTSSRDYHVIGFSLGGQVAGIAGRNAGTVGYITALDPAGPLWYILFANQRLQKTDGEYTEVIHTNAGFAGFLLTLGHVDFYPNGGTFMPGCSKFIGDVSNAAACIISSLNDTASDSLTCNLYCHHDRSNRYMAESIRSGGFLGKECENVYYAMVGLCNGTDTLNMGGLVPKYGKTGVYYLTTNAEASYSKTV